MLISSGFVQFAVHFCPENGAMLSAENCHMHRKSQLHDCCKPAKAEKPAEDNCCNDQFVYNISPKFGSVDVAKLQIQWINIHPVNTLHLQPMVAELTGIELIEIHGKPPLCNRRVQQNFCTYLI
jgi:hypothetical protein